MTVETNTRRRRQFSVRFGDDEMKWLREVAEKRGLAQATVIRVLVREELGRLRGGPFGEAIKVPM